MDSNTEDIESKETISSNLESTSPELIEKVKSIIIGFESGELKFVFGDQITSDDTPVEVYLKASNMINGYVPPKEWIDAKNKMMEIMSKYEQIIQGGIKSTPKEYAHAVNDYYRVFSQMRKAGKIKGTFTVTSDKEKISNIENRLDKMDERFNKFETYLKKLADDAGI